MAALTGTLRDPVGFVRALSAMAAVTGRAAFFGSSDGVSVYVVDGARANQYALTLPPSAFSAFASARAVSGDVLLGGLVAVLRAVDQNDSLTLCMHADRSRVEVTIGAPHDGTVRAFDVPLLASEARVHRRLASAPSDVRVVLPATELARVCGCVASMSVMFVRIDATHESVSFAMRSETLGSACTTLRHGGPVTIDARSVVRLTCAARALQHASAMCPPFAPVTLLLQRGAALVATFGGVDASWTGTVHASTTIDDDVALP